MAADRNRLAAALAYEQERRRRLAEVIPTPGPVTAAPTSPNLRRDLENLSIGVGEGITNQLEGLKDIVTDPIGSAKAGYEAVRGIVRDPSVLAEALRQTGQKAMSGPLGAGEVIGEMVNPIRGKAPLMREIDVYHGSPHRFEEFDASKIGTGEGAQAYGHGIYLAEKPSTAEIYRRALAEDVISVDGRRIAAKRTPEARNDPETIAVDAIVSAHGGQYEDPFSKAIERLGGKYGPRNENYAKAMELAREWRGKGAKVEVGGNLYTADLPDEMVDRMLDWDKRISDQPEFVQKAWADWRATPQAQKLVKQMTARGSSAQDIEKMFANPTGETMHKWIYEGYGSAKGGEMPKVAQFLKDKGLLGVKYQDAGSRGQGGTGTRNFVVFPGEEKKVRILERK